jgi:hypothetical protein
VAGAATGDCFVPMVILSLQALVGGRLTARGAVGVYGFPTGRRWHSPVNALVRHGSTGPVLLPVVTVLGLPSVVSAVMQVILVDHFAAVPSGTAASVRLFSGQTLAADNDVRTSTL